MLGHTDKATINKRRPLTDNTKRVLADLVLAVRILHRSLTQSEQNAMKALMVRGYAHWNIEDRSYSATEAGRAALTSQHRSQGE